MFFFFTLRNFNCPLYKSSQAQLKLLAEKSLIVIYTKAPRSAHLTAVNLVGRVFGPWSFHTTLHLQLGSIFLLQSLLQEWRTHKHTKGNIDIHNKRLAAKASKANSQANQQKIRANLLEKTTMVSSQRGDRKNVPSPTRRSLDRN